MKPDTTLSGTPCWIDLLTSDTAKATEFYTSLFGWTAGDPDPNAGGYFVFNLDGKAVGGCMYNSPEMGDTPDGWGVNLHTDDAAKTVELSEQNGGTTLYPAMDVLDYGVMAVFQDPGGATISAWQPKKHAGFEVLREPNAPTWFEQHTRNHAAVVKYYENTFGWTTSPVSDTDEFRYTVLGAGEEMRAGIMDNSVWVPEGTPGQWSIYISVLGTDDYVAKAVDLGGSVAHAVQDSPFGRVAELTDPTGVRIKIIDETVKIGEM